VGRGFFLPLPHFGQLVTWYAPEVRQFVKSEGFGLNLLAFQVVALERPAPMLLQMTLERPMDQARVASERIVVAGKVSGGKGVARVLATLNGVEVFTQEEWRAANNEVTLNFPITLCERKNVLLVTAADPEGYTVQAARTLFYGQSTEPLPPRSAVPSDYRGHRPTPAPCVRSCAPSSTSGPRWPRLRPWSRPAWCRRPWSRAAGPW
jgi:hypothetical protein